MAPALALDPRNLERLRAEAGASPDKAIREAAKQFEVLFVNMLLKSMRDASPQNGPLDSEQTRLYTGMLDQQLAQAMASRGIGLADVMVRQLSNGRLEAPQTAGDASVPRTTLPALGAGLQSMPPEAPSAAPSSPAAAVVPTAATASASLSAAGPRVREFVDRMWPHAVEASKSTGIPALFILGQAALESGWGQREIRTADGAASHNLFGIKAGRSWAGASAETTTHEFVNGVKQKIVDRFRAYSSYADAFKDYAHMLKSNPRYAAVIEAGNDARAFAEGLQKAGYASDPAYAAKLQRIITGSVLRQGLAAG